jgi:hypothetical protein
MYHKVKSASNSKEHNETVINQEVYLEILAEKNNSWNKGK